MRNQHLSRRRRAHRARLSPETVMRRRRERDERRALGYRRLRITIELARARRALTFQRRTFGSRARIRKLETKIELLTAELRRVERATAKHSLAADSA